MKTLLFAGAVLAPFSSLAQTTEVASVTLPEVVVTATRTPVKTSEALAAVTVIDRAQIERAQATDVAEILRFEAGIDLGRNGGPGSFTSAFIRGGESNHTLVLIDGVRVNPATSGGAALQNIAPEMIERIEIVRGPRSTLYGSDAIGGVINVITRTSDKPDLGISLRGGEEDTRDVAANLGYGNGRHSLSLHAQHLSSDGIPSCAGATIDRGYRNTTLNLRGATQVSEGTRLSARVWNSEGNAEYASCGEFGSLSNQDYQNRVGAIDLSLTPSQHWSSTLTLSHGEDDIRQQQENFLGEKDVVRTVRPMLDWHNIVQVGSAHRVSFGLTGSREDVDAISFGTVIAEEREIYAGFVQDEFTFGRHQISAAVNLSDYEGFGEQFNWNLDYGFALRPSTRLIASASTGFRAPDASDRFGFGGDPDLDPEEARNLELGLRHALTEHQSLDLRAFHIEVDDLISVEFDPANDPDIDFGFRAVNIDEYRNRGAELTWRYATAQWTASLSGIAQKPEDRSTGDLLLRRAKRSVTARLTRHFGPHYMGIDLLGSGERRDVTADTGAPTIDPGYALVNLSGGLRVHSNYRVQARVENLFDKKYETAAGYNQPGATVYVSLSYAL